MADTEKTTQSRKPLTKVTPPKLETKAVKKSSEKLKPTPDPSQEKTSAKAGKRSPKSLKEAEAKTIKEEHKVSLDKTKPSLKLKPPRSKLERRSKKYRQVFTAIDPTKTYKIIEAIGLIKKSSPTKFDASIELHVNLAVDPKQADQNIRGSVNLPNGSGKTVKLAALSEDPIKAKSAGADLSSPEEIYAALDKNKIDFDILLATPKQMPTLAKYARLLGPRGLMPNPKSGTVTSDIEKAIKETKKGKVEYRVDEYGIVHLAIAKVSFEQDKVAANAEAVIDNLKQNKPQSVRGAYIKSIHLASSMGPSVELDLATIA